MCPQVNFYLKKLILNLKFYLKLGKADYPGTSQREKFQVYMRNDRITEKNL